MQAQPFDDDPAHAHRRSRISCLLDGDHQGASAEEACTAWRDDEHWRATWHRYHLIGDVMRSSELASPPDRDEAFLHRFRERLAAEPIVLAPGALADVVPGRRSRLGWIGPAAVAAGFVAVAGVVVAVRMAQGGDPAAGFSTLASAASSAAGGSSVAATRVASEQQEATAAVQWPDAAMIRDTDIDRYFRAHRGMSASPAAAMPGGALRNVDTIVQR